jgi:hypothetical protein
MVALVLSALASCDTTYKINHPHVQHSRGKSDRWTKLNISMNEAQKNTFSETASAVPTKEVVE